jgi:hypothetical protein
MPDDGKGEGAPIEGLAGGPGPTPPGFDDGTPRIEPPREPGEDPAAPPRAPEEHDEERKAAGSRGATRADPEEPDPS